MGNSLSFINRYMRNLNEGQLLTLDQMKVTYALNLSADELEHLRSSDFFSGIESDHPSLAEISNLLSLCMNCRPLSLVANSASFRDLLETWNSFPEMYKISFVSTIWQIHEANLIEVVEEEKKDWLIDIITSSLLFMDQKRGNFSEERLAELDRMKQYYAFYLSTRAIEANEEAKEKIADLLDDKIVLESRQKATALMQQMMTYPPGMLLNSNIFMGFWKIFKQKTFNYQNLRSLIEFLLGYFML